MLKRIFIIWFFVGVLVTYWGWKLGNTENSVIACIPTFPDGDGPYYKTDAPQRYKIVPQNSNGEKLVISGKLLRNDCKGVVANTIIDIWQADETGVYKDDWYRGRVTTDSKGRYKFETVMPSGYGEGTGFRPPHIHFKIWENNKLLITSEMFFPESKGKHGIEDAFIMKLNSKTFFNKTTHTGYHDIILP